MERRLTVPRTFTTVRGRRTRSMARIDGVDPQHVTDDYTTRVLAAQAKTWGAPLLNHLVYARLPALFRAVRGMWTGLDGLGGVDARLTALLNRRVAALNRCAF
jgi:hypothetical protein